MSNDNPFSEAQFRTVKYRPEFPCRFGALEHARSVSRDLCAWYNDAHHGCGLSYLTPADVHYGRAATGPGGPSPHTAGRLTSPIASGSCTGHPVPRRCPRAVWINRPPTLTSQVAPGTTTVTPVDPQPGVMSPPQRRDDGAGTLVTSVESLQ